MLFNIKKKKEKKEEEEKISGGGINSLKFHAGNMFLKWDQVIFINVGAAP